MNSPFDAGNAESLRQHCQHVLRRASRSRADVLLLQCGEHRAVLKDYSHANRGFARFIAPFLVHREVKALRALDGVDGVPRLLRRVSARALLMEYMPTRRLRDAGDGFDWHAFLQKTEQLIARLHARGVVHGDLRHPGNVLIDARDNPVLVDWVSAVHRGRAWNPLAYWLFKRCVVMDTSALDKLRRKYIADNSPRTRQGWLERIARGISALVRRAIDWAFRL